MKIISKVMACVLCAGLMLNFASCIHDAGKEPVMYEVSYVTEYGECPRSFLVEENTVLTADQLPRMKKEDFFFAGWYDGEVKALSKKYKVTHNVKLTAKWKVPVELKTCDEIHELFKWVIGHNFRNPRRFSKSKIKPGNPVYFLDVTESEVPLWYDEENRTIYYYIEEGKALGLRSKPNVDDFFELSGLFEDFESIESIDTSDFDTSNVTNMSKMFFGCKSLKQLDLSSFETSNVTEMYNMFLCCWVLDELDLSNFDTRNVTIMCSMFGACMNLNELDLSNFDTSNVTNMFGMFSSCSINELDLSSFKTHNVTNMRGMFAGCPNLSKLNISSFDTSNVTDMNCMFSGCRFNELELKNFETSKVTDMGAMFNGCKSLTELDLNSFETSNVTDMYGMFYECESLTKIITSDKFVTDKVKLSNYMFENCNALKGGAGTVYNADHVDKEYARIDGGPDKPGYFTAEE